MLERITYCLISIEVYLGHPLKVMIYRSLISSNSLSISPHLGFVTVFNLVIKSVCRESFLVYNLHFLVIQQL